jgi:hypothetical protein
MTKVDQRAIIAIIYEAIELLNGQRSANAQLISSPDLLLVGDHGTLDSLEISTLVLAVERKVKETTGIDVDIFGADFDENIDKIRTPASLAEAIFRQIS